MVCHDPVVYGIICENLLLSHIVLILLQQPFWQCIVKLHACIRVEGTLKEMTQPKQWPGSSFDMRDRCLAPSHR